MLTLAIILIIAASVLLILIVLAQNSKGGGLSSTFGSSGGQMGGVVQTNKFLEKTTWTLAIALIVFSITASVAIPRQEESAESKAQKALKELNQMETTPNILSPEQIEGLNNEENK
ncbi:MAG: preprotein translocase subunit SecG [Bacteroidales bacterium]|nr:preprotein translocase subunit SecG [Bacteroidales bacterium]